MELSAQELRLGNYVNCPNKNIPWFCITEFEYLNAYDRNHCKVGMQFIPKTQPYTWLLEDLSPIPLTDEWLLKFGKIKWLSKDIGGYFYWFNGEKKYIKFVHVLQNTYFCIEQKELTINILCI